MRESAALLSEAWDILTDPDALDSPPAVATSCLEAAETALLALQVHGDLKVVTGLGLVDSWLRLEGEEIVPELPKMPEHLEAIIAAESLAARPDSLGPTAEQAAAAREGADWLLKVTALVLSPSTLLAQLFPRGEDEDAPGL
jgi:hypothetical protein